MSCVSEGRGLSTIGGLAFMGECGRYLIVTYFIGSSYLLWDDQVQAPSAVHVLSLFSPLGKVVSRALIQ